MAKRPVYWYEGMFLKPHHFQAAERHVLERVREAEDWLSPHNWGFRQLSVDEDAVANFEFRLRSCKARFKDGTTLVVEEGAVDRLDLRGVLRSAVGAQIFLAIPTWQASRANVEASPTPTGPRYCVESVECADENTGSHEELVEFRNVRARLFAEGQLPEGYEMLPVARVVRTEAENAPPKVDRTYVPPILGLEVWKPLHEEVLSLFQQIGAWVTQYAEQLSGRKAAFNSQVLGDTELILRLSVLNTAQAAMKAIVQTDGFHPREMYRELCRLLGQLSLFSERHCVMIDVPTYDHDNIGPVYTPVLAEILRLLRKGRMNVFVKRMFGFNPQRRRYEVNLESEWLLDGSRLYIGVQTDDPMSDDECDQLVNRFDHKLASSDVVEDLFNGGMPGLTVRPLRRIPAELPTGWVYFEVERDPQLWRQVVRSGTLAYRFKKDRTQFLDAETITLKSPKPDDDHSFSLRIAAFYVKPG